MQDSDGNNNVSDASLETSVRKFTQAYQVFNNFSTAKQ